MPKDTASRIVHLFVRDSTTGLGKTALAHGDVTIYRTKQNTAAVQITTAAGSVGDAYSSGKWAEVSATNAKGKYLFHEPDNLFDTLGPVSYQVVATGAIDVEVSYEVVEIDRADAVRAGLTALPDADADAAGGVPISDAGGLDLDARLGKLNVSGTLAHSDAASTYKATGFAVAGDQMTLQDGAITAAKFAANAITATVLANNAITNAKLAAGAITASTYAANAITSTVLATDAITSTQLATNAADEIAAQVELAILNEGDGQAILQAIADQIAADWVAGDASPLAVASAVWAHVGRSLDLVSGVNVEQWLGQAVSALSPGIPDVGIGAGGASLSAIPWNNAGWDAEVQSEVDDALRALFLHQLFETDYDPASKPGVASALLNELIGDDGGGVSEFTAGALANAPSGSGGDATAANQTTLIDRLGALAGSGDNTVLGILRAMARSDVSAPTDIGGTFNPAQHSEQAIRVAIDGLSVGAGSDHPLARSG